MSQGRPARLLTTRWRTAVAVVVTAYLLVLAIRGPLLHLGHTQSGWLLPLEFLLHGWLLIAANVALYAYLCWLALWFIRGTDGRESIFMAGWFAHLVLYPVEKLWPQSVVVIQYIGDFGLVVALLAAMSLLSRPAPAADVAVPNSAS